jgi:hypothetical protein
MYTKHTSDDGQCPTELRFNFDGAEVLIKTDCLVIQFTRLLTAHCYYGCYDKGKGKGKVVPVLEYHAMKAYWGSGDTTPRILTSALDRS